MLTDPVTSSAPTSAVGVARQAIFDRDGRIFGYEMLFRMPPASQAPVMTTEAQHERATAEVVRAMVLRQATAGGDRDALLFVNFPRAFLVGDLPLLLPPDRLVVEVLEHVVPDDELIGGVRKLRRRGYRLAVDDWGGEDGRDQLIAECQFVKIDLGLVEPGALGDLVAGVNRRWPQVSVVVERLETAADVALARDCGADLFQGFHLDAPEYQPTPLP